MLIGFAKTFSQVKELNGKIYKTIVIGEQTWMSENLAVTKFSNGENIPFAKSNAEWENAGENGTPAYCYYKNDPTTVSKYGLLYNWYAVNDPRGLAPEGFQIPEIEDWDELVYHLGDDAGKKMKSKSNWLENGNGTNSSGFSALPGGVRNGVGTYEDLGKTEAWWSSSEYASYGAKCCILYSFDNSVLLTELNTMYGLHVRCLKD